jgi:hypothetical protein
MGLRLQYAAFNGSFFIMDVLGYFAVQNQKEIYGRNFFPFCL